MVTTSPVPISVVKNGVETMLNTLAYNVETREGFVTGLEDMNGPSIEVAGRTGSLYRRGRKRSEKSLTLNMWVNDQDVDGAQGDYVTWRKNVDTLNALFDTTDTQIELREYLNGSPSNNRTNLAINPSFRSASGTVPVRTNYCLNPNTFGSSNDGSKYTLTADPAVGRTVGGAMRGEPVSGAAFGNILMSAYNLGACGLNSIPVTVGDTWTFSCYVAANIACTAQASMRYADANGAFGTATFGNLITLTPIAGATPTANEWVRISVTMTAPAGVTKVWTPGVTMLTSAGQPVPVAGTSKGWYCDSLLEKSGAVMPFFSGNTPNGTFDLNLQSQWTGAVNNSTSLAFGNRVEFWVVQSAYAAVWQAEDGASVYVRISGSGNAINGTGAPLYSEAGIPCAGGTVVSASIRNRNSAYPVRFIIQEYAGSGTIGNGSSTYSPEVSAGQPSAIGGYKTNATTGNVRVVVKFPAAGLAPGQTMQFDQVLIEFAPGSKPYFDGSTPNDGMRYAWVNQPNRSYSTASVMFRKALAEVRANNAPKLQASWYGDLKVECVINSGYWQDDQPSTYTSPAAGPVLATHQLAPLQGGTGYIEDAFIVIDGPINSPILTDKTSGSVLSLFWNVPAGQQWVVNCATYESFMGTAIENNPSAGLSMAQYTFSKGPQAPALFTIAPSAVVELAGSNTTATTRLRITANRKFH